MTRDGSARILAVSGRDIVEKARVIHNTTPTATAALGRTLMAASMMGSILNGDNDSVTLRFAGDGAGGQILCVGDSFGFVRGLIGNPAVDLPLNEKGKLNVSGAVGKGNLYVMRDTGADEPYIGISRIVSGEIAEDIASYFVTSEQVPTVCALGVLVDTDYSVKTAGGIIVQLLPFADDEVASKLEENVSRVSSVTGILETGSLEDVINAFMEGIEYDVFDKSEVGYRCNCSRQRCEKALISLGDDDFRSLYEDEKTEMNCSFCERKYVFTHSDLDALDAGRKHKQETK